MQLPNVSRSRKLLSLHSAAGVFSRSCKLPSRQSVHTACILVYILVDGTCQIHPAERLQQLPLPVYKHYMCQSHFKPSNAMRSVNKFPICSGI